jgi:flagellar assembly protein FliH
MGLIKAANTPPSVSPFSMRDIEQHAKQVILRARRQAEELLAEAQVSAEALKREAHEQGLAEGHAQGLKQGTEEGRKSGHQQALNENKAQLAQVIQSLTAAMQAYDESQRKLEVDGLREVIELASAIAWRVTKRAGLIDPEVLTANLREAMKLVVQSSDLRIAIHPSQKATLMRELPAMQMQWPQLAHAELLEDAALAPGGCRLFTRGGLVDADLHEQLDRVINEFLPAPALAESS